ncbi:hypothetical protein AVEN_150228-1 [Araneus ventricosus]|uniref:Uncharacterized protein n=1 Tax=Araneus ventricosus TaxID=182803 RepID=A0A4Y2G601_ARAVE|nr:hypothetical protein AVEN_150228-1 [Araneus ventricosus]
MHFTYVAASRTFAMRRQVEFYSSMQHVKKLQLCTRTIRPSIYSSAFPFPSDRDRECKQHKPTHLSEAIMEKIEIASIYLRYTTHTWVLTAAEESNFIEKCLQDLNPVQPEATQETDELPRSHPSSKTTPKETAVRHKDKNRGSATGSFAPWSFRVLNSKARIRIYFDQAKVKRTINPNL